MLCAKYNSWEIKFKKRTFHIWKVDLKLTKTLWQTFVCTAQHLLSPPGVREPLATTLFCRIAMLGQKDTRIQGVAPVELQYLSICEFPPGTNPAKPLVLLTGCFIWIPCAGKQWLVWGFGNINFQINVYMWKCFATNTKGEKGWERARGGKDEFQTENQHHHNDWQSCVFVFLIFIYARCLRDILW